MEKNRRMETVENMERRRQLLRPGAEHVSSRSDSGYDSTYRDSDASSIRLSANETRCENCGWPWVKSQDANLDAPSVRRSSESLQSRRGTLCSIGEGSESECIPCTTDDQDGVRVLSEKLTTPRSRKAVTHSDVFQFDIQLEAEGPGMSPIDSDSKAESDSQDNAKYGTDAEQKDEL